MIRWVSLVFQSYCHTGKVLCPCSWRGDNGSYTCIWYLSWTLPYVLLPLDDFNLHPFPVINHYYEYKLSASSVSPSGDEGNYGNLRNLRLLSEVRVVLCGDYTLARTDTHTHTPHNTYLFIF